MTKQQLDLKGVKFTWLGHATFRAETPGGRSVIIDPWVQNNPACPETPPIAHALPSCTMPCNNPPRDVSTVVGAMRELPSKPHVIAITPEMSAE